MGLTPAFSISVNGVAASDVLNKRLISVRITDEAGIQSDSCDLEFDDYDDALQIPKGEAIITIALGYKETGLVRIGSYYVKEIRLNGGRHTMSISGHAMSKSMQSEKNKSHVNKKLGNAVSDMANEYNLNGAVDDEYSEYDLDNAPQIHESDVSYLTRKAIDLGGIAKPTNGNLVFARDLEAKSISGKSLPTLNIKYNEISDYSCILRGSDVTTSGTGGKTIVGTIYANWYDKATGEYKPVKVGEGDPEIWLDQVFNSEAEAQQATRAKEKRIIKNNKRLEFSCAGNPKLLAEYPINLVGFPSKIPTNWIITHAEHVLDSSGYKTIVECTIR